MDPLKEPKETKYWLMFFFGMAVGGCGLMLLTYGESDPSCTRMLTQKVKENKKLTADNSICTNAHALAVAEVEKLQHEAESNAIEAEEKEEALAYVGYTATGIHEGPCPTEKNCFAKEITLWQTYRNATGKLSRYAGLRNYIDSMIDRCSQDKACILPPAFASESRLPLVLSLCPYDNGGDMQKLDACLLHWFPASREQQ